MPRDDMFNWLLGKKKKDTAASTALANQVPEAVPTKKAAPLIEAPHAAPAAKSADTPSPIDAPAQVPAPLTAGPALAALEKSATPFRSGNLAPPKPRVGMNAIELAHPRTRDAQIIGIQAGGRRIVAKVNPAGRAYAYTLKQDGSYRLEGNTSAAAPQLVLEAEA